MQLIIKVDVDNDAFHYEHIPQVARILLDLSDKVAVLVRDDLSGMAVQDSYGRVVGSIQYHEVQTEWRAKECIPKSEST